MSPENMHIGIEQWLPGEMGSPAERLTAAEVLITVGNRCITDVEDFESKSVRSTMRVSADTLAKWLLANWWRLRWEPERVSSSNSISWSMAHSMAAAGNGYAWPDLTFVGSDGTNIHVEMKQHEASRLIAPIRYIRAFATTITAASFENAVGSFVETTLARLSTRNMRTSELLTLWNDIKQERTNSKAALLRKFEALLGLDPDDDEELISILSKSAGRIGTSALEEIMAGSDRTRVKADIDQIGKLVKTTKTFADMSTLRMSPGTVLDDASPWRRGQEAAYALRNVWSLGMDRVTNAQIADLLQTPLDKLEVFRANAPFSFGIRGPQPDKMAIVINREHPHGRRFDAVRLLGDYIYTESGQILPATTSTTVRQKFQRAFAAEFLCPSRMIVDRFGDKIDPRSLAKILDTVTGEYDVSEQLVRHHLENRGLLTNDLGQNSLIFV